MYTIAKATYLFFEAHPDKTVQIRANEERRLRIYNSIFQRSYEEIKRSFEVDGIMETLKEPYDPKKSYTLFELRLKRS